MEEQNLEVRSQKPEETPNPQSLIPNPGLLDLAAPERTVRIRFAGRTATHIFRRITLADWLEYLKTSNAQIIRDEENSIFESHEDEAAAALWAKAIVRVQGYKMQDSGSRIQESGIIEKMPLAHKLAAVEMLQEIFSFPADDPFDLDMETRLVRLEANWNEAVFENLLHRFRRPSQEHALKFQRTQAEAFYRRRRDRHDPLRVLIPPQLKALNDLYDELIVKLEGYTWPEKDSGQQWMDPLHKQAAVLGLFEKPERVPFQSAGDKRELAERAGLEPGRG